MIGRIVPAGLAGILAVATGGACGQHRDAEASPAAESPGPIEAPVPAGVEGEETGLAVGSQAPRFTLSDQSGERRSLDEFLGEGKKVALVFYRSADW
ncbi:thioredoxin domain-containing protein [Tautonia plasticadhaerens]|uniref:Uncharacterized protein n=1 Tax=Tautonia plasticadhaerens TaxID=2527974 RepID=A0A518GVE3_9BACT|nr:redoxin domain-containing protein [Tautonia plasticadhaerens]QDV32551.1 hypothetical protein ElP_03850 [Tautonia plasticadhaerens]